MEILTKNTLNKIVLVVALVAGACIRLYELIKAPLYSWDASVYIGIGKYIFSSGMFGLTETFRPPLLSLIQGIMWKIGFDPMIAGGVVVILASVIASVVVYKWGNKMGEYAGLSAAMILFYTPVFVLYSHIPMTDVLSVTITLISMYAMLQKHYFIAGVLAALAFLTRFSHGLSIIVIGISTIFIHSQEYKTYLDKVLLKKLMAIAAGALLLLIPYFGIAQYIYGDFLAPLKAGTSVIGHSLHVYDKGNLFYFTAPFLNNYMLLFAVIGIIMALYKIVAWKKISPAIITVLVAILVYMTYFTFEVHKELRYSVAFLPFISLLAGLGIQQIVVFFKMQRIIVILLICTGSAYAAHNYYSFIDPPITSERSMFYEFFNNSEEGTKIIATEPMSVARGNTLLMAPLYDSWNTSSQVYEKYKNDISYVSLDSCILESACSVDSGCKKGKDDFLKTLATEATLVFSENDRQCELRIYQLR